MSSGKKRGGGGFILLLVSYESTTKFQMVEKVIEGWIKQVFSFSIPSFSLLPAKALHVSGVFEMSSREPMDKECSAEGLLRGGGKGEISVSLVS